MATPIEIDPQLRDPTSAYDALAHYARLLTEKHDLEITLPWQNLSSPPVSIPQIAGIYKDRPGDIIPVPIITPSLGHKVVGILGAGVGGLYAAMMLESLQIPYEVLEASNRTGGRLYTYEFSCELGDYFDVGAMRFPMSNVMKRLFHLLCCKQLNPPHDLLWAHIIPYFFANDNTFLYYNGIRARQSDPDVKSKDFNYSKTGVPMELILQGYEETVWQSIGHFVTGLREDAKQDPPSDKGWKNLMKYDHYSTRGYMTHHSKYSQPTINWMESRDRSTGWYDRGLTETVLEMVAWGDHSDQPMKFCCLYGGSKVLSDAMEHYIRKCSPDALVFCAPVHSIEANARPGSLANSVTVGLTVNGRPEIRTYQHVISTLPLPCLRTIDIDKAGFSVTQTNALRQCRYGPALKIAIKFKTAWWTKFNIVGGQSYTDANIRTVVYPSYPTTVLIVSYSWTDDSLRTGALINAGRSFDLQLKELCLRELAAIHDLKQSDLEAEYIAHYPFNWTQDPMTRGAYAFFGPCQFNVFYNELTYPAADGRLHVAGEAISIRHAWVVGALSSAWRAVRQILVMSYPHKIKQFEAQWGKDPEWTAQGPGKPLTEDLLLLHIIANKPELFKDSH